MVTGTLTALPMCSYSLKGPCLVEAVELADSAVRAPHVTSVFKAVLALKNETWKNPQELAES